MRNKNCGVQQLLFTDGIGLFSGSPEQCCSYTESINRENERERDMKQCQKCSCKRKCVHSVKA